MLLFLISLTLFQKIRTTILKLLSSLFHFIFYFWLLNEFKCPLVSKGHILVQTATYKLCFFIKIMIFIIFINIILNNNFFYLLETKKDDKRIHLKRKEKKRNENQILFKHEFCIKFYDSFFITQSVRQRNWLHLSYSKELKLVTIYLHIAYKSKCICISAQQFIKV